MNYIFEYLEKYNIPVVAFNIFAVLLLILILGFTFELLRRRKNVSDDTAYYNSIMYEDEDVSRFNKMVNTCKKFYFCSLGENGYCLKNAKDKVVFEAIKTDSGFTYAEYEFKNTESGTSEKHKIGSIKKNDFGVNSFLYDNEDIWEYIKKLKIRYKITSVSNELTMYQVKLANGKDVLAKRRKSENGDYYFRVLTKDKDMKTLFLIIFTFEICEAK